MLTRSHIQSLTVALIVLLMGAAPVYFAVSILRTTQGALVESRQHDRSLEATFDVRSKIEKLREATGDKVTDAELMRLGVRFLAMAMDGSDITAEMFIEANS